MKVFTVRFIRFLAVSCILGMSLMSQERTGRVPAGGAPPEGSGSIDWTGFIRVIDGDTVEILLNGNRVGVAIAGIKAPEVNTPCGVQAATYLRSLLGFGVHLDEVRGKG